jgi:hypothetical protein
MPSVLPHNQRAGSTWGSGGEAYEAISENVADGIAHVVSRVWPTPGGRFLNIATGTGVDGEEPRRARSGGYRHRHRRRRDRSGEAPWTGN